jgi:hypothetical protein
MERYLVMGLSGGLGNQLFQYASGLGIATRLAADLRLDDTWVEPRDRWLPGILGDRYRAASRVDLLRVGEGGGGERAFDKSVREAVRLGVGGMRRVRRRTPAVSRPQRTEDVARFDPSLLEIDLPALLLGWHQTERYFEAVADDVDAHLRLPAPSLPTDLAAARPLVAVSFRRGDYVRLGWQLPFSYYERALERMLHDVPDAHFLVFGDDREFVELVTPWVARYGPASDAYTLTDGVLEHLVLAGGCDHAVIANSSFAWWGAWLAERRVSGRARVRVLASALYPQRFGDDIVPDRWELIPAD